MERAETSQHAPAWGITLMVLSVTVFTVMSAFIKAADRVPAGEAMFFRAVFTLPVIIVWLVLRGELVTGIRTKNMRSHAVRGVAGSVAMGLGFAGLKYLPLPEVTAIRFVTPVVMLVLAAVLLGERLRLVRISAVAVGLIGVLIIVWPRLSTGAGTSEAFGAMIVLGSACLAALAQVFVKSMVGRESTAAIVFYFALTASVLSLFTLPFGWVWPTSQEAALLIGAGVVGGLGQILLTSSYRFAEAGVLAPFTYVSMLWSIIIGYVWFLEIPTRQMLLGAGLIIMAGGIIVYRERQLGTQKTARRKVEAKGIQ